jgi:isoamylase
MRERAFLHPGATSPMGAHCRDGGINFAVFSDHATRIELCIFDPLGERELDRRALFGPIDGVFHGFIPGVDAGLVYGFRAWGSSDRSKGHCFNPETVLLDPYAKEILNLHKPSHQVAAPGVRFLARVVRAESSLLLVQSNFQLDPSQRVLYEVHVKGFSNLHPDIPEALRGKYLGLSHPAAIAHFKSIGVNSVSILPVYAGLDEHDVAKRGKVNYWGYNTLGYFYPSPRYAVNAADPCAVRDEFKQMVQQLHAAGIEVVLDVVYNHTVEGGLSERVFSFRGLDNSSWYRGSGTPWRDHNVTGCGNALNFQHAKVRQFVLDSMRYWIQEMGVDGFRFDLAPVHGRECEDFSTDAPFFKELAADPILSKKLMIAEPWDAGSNGYQVGQFPKPFIEWNDQFRDAVRGFWIGSQVNRGKLAAHLAGSSNLFKGSDRSPLTSVNFICVHDGFTLRDMLSYSRKHNHANGEDNRDGRDNELCNNCGMEGPTLQSKVLEKRSRLSRAFFASLLLAQGTPMLGSGDEMGKTQMGNNNAYCQDTEINWLDWQRKDKELMRWVGGLVLLRSVFPLLHHAQWFQDKAGEQHAALVWFDQRAQSLSIQAWHDVNQLSLMVLFLPATKRVPSTAEKPCLLIFNGDNLSRDFVLPKTEALQWRLMANSDSGQCALPTETIRFVKGQLNCAAQSVQLLIAE